MSAGTGPSVAAEGTRPNPLYDDPLSPGAQHEYYTSGHECPACRVRWTGDEECWICGAKPPPRPQILYPHPFYGG